jgi:hypothetical protein
VVLRSNGDATHPLLLIDCIVDSEGGYEWFGRSSARG